MFFFTDLCYQYYRQLSEVESPVILFLCTEDISIACIWFILYLLFLFWLTEMLWKPADVVHYTLTQPSSSGTWVQSAWEHWMLVSKAKRKLPSCKNDIMSVLSVARSNFNSQRTYEKTGKQQLPTNRQSLVIIKYKRLHYWYPTWIGFIGNHQIDLVISQQRTRKITSGLHTRSFLGCRPNARHSLQFWILRILATRNTV